MKSSEKSDKFADLRNRARDFIAQNPESRQKLSKDDIHYMVEELHTHQIELEMQNEELIQSRAEKEVILSQYTDLYDFAPVGYFILVQDSTIHQVNLAGADLLGVERNKLIKRRFGLFVSVESRPTFNAFLEKVFISQHKETCEVALSKDGSDPLWIYIEAITKDKQECRATLIDITKRKRIEIEKEQAIKKLEEASALVKKLSGLIPICSSCKKIRDDKGYWNEVSGYIADHSEAEFTHGMCPDCMKKWYPDYVAEKETKEGS